MPEITDQTVADEPWRLNICPDCGYSFETLPAIGICPECGYAYNRADVILTGFGRGAHANLTTARWRHMWPMGLIWFMRLMVLPSHTLGLWDLFWMGLVLPQWILTLVTRFSNTKPGLCRVHLSAAGCSQLANAFADDGNFTQPVNVIGCFYAPVYLFVGAVLLHVLGGKSSPGIWLVFAALAFLIGACVLFRHLQRRIQKEGLPAIQKSDVTPWHAIGRVIVSPATKGCHRIRLRLINPNWRLKQDPVDIEVECTPQRAAHLNSLIVKWHRPGVTHIFGKSPS